MTPEPVPSAAERAAPKRPKFPLRWNVLGLMFAGYLSVVLVYVGLIFFAGEDAPDAYGVVEAPLMALIGGSVAIAKDLLNADTTPHP